MNNPGYVYAPYIPVTETPKLDYSDFKPSKNLASRYSAKTINGVFYSSIFGTTDPEKIELQINLQKKLDEFFY